MKNGLRIDKIKATEVLNSRGNPCPQVSVRLCCGAVGISAAPSGASRGTAEAVELLDEDDSRYFGKGTLKAVDVINNIIAPELEGRSVLNLQGIDEKLRKIDGTENFKNIGGNSAVAVSVASAKALAIALGVPLFAVLGGVYKTQIPTPMINLINGGAHGKNNLDIQEFMLVPNESLPFSEKARMGSEVFKMVGKILEEKSLSPAIGDEGGYAVSPYGGTDEALEIIVKGAENAGYKPYSDFKIALDFAASSWEKDGIYYFPKNAISKTREEMLDYVLSLYRKYPIFSVEDPFSENDYENWAELTRKVPKGSLVVGDDLFVTNKEKLKIGAEQGLGNAVIIKPNQVGTLTGAIRASEFAKSNGYSIIASHRSGETNDSSICDLSMAISANYIKIGGPSRGERIEKYNRFLRIEQMF